MIYKNFELKKINLKQSKLILLYGKNEALKNHVIQEILKDKTNIIKYEEKEIIDNSKLFVENLLSKSLFENEKIIIIKRVTDKILNIIEETKKINLDDIIIILNSENLEKRSKLRSYFEKSKRCLYGFLPRQWTNTHKNSCKFLKTKRFLYPKRI